MSGAEAGQWVWAAGALLGVLLLMFGAGQLARRRIGGAMPRGARRIAVVEVTPIDARRRAVLLRVDGREALVMTGGGGDVVVGWL